MPSSHLPESSAHHGKQRKNFRSKWPSFSSLASSANFSGFARSELYRLSVPGLFSLLLLLDCASPGSSSPLSDSAAEKNGRGDRTHESEHLSQKDHHHQTPDFQSILEKLQSNERTEQLRGLQELDYQAHVLAHGVIFAGERPHDLMPTLHRIADRAIFIAENDESMAPVALHSLRHMPSPPVRDRMERIARFVHDDKQPLRDAALELMISHAAFVAVIKEISNTEAGSIQRGDLYSAASAILSNAREYHQGKDSFMPYRWQLAIKDMDPDLSSQCESLPSQTAESAEQSDRNIAIGFSLFLAALDPSLAKRESLLRCLHQKALGSENFREKQYFYFALSSIQPDRVSVRRLARYVRENRDEHERRVMVGPLTEPGTRHIARDLYMQGFEQSKDARLKMESALALRVLGRAVAYREYSSAGPHRVESRNKEDEAFQDDLLDKTNGIQPDRDLAFAIIEIYEKPPDFEITVREYLRRLLLRYEGEPVPGLVPIILTEFDGSYKPEDVVRWQTDMPTPHIQDMDTLIKRCSWLPHFLALGQLGPKVRPRIMEVVFELTVPSPGGVSYEPSRQAIASIGLQSEKDIVKLLDYLQKNGRTNLTHVSNAAFALGALTPDVKPQLREKVADTLWVVAREGELGRLIAADSIYRIDPSQKQKLIDYYIEELKSKKQESWAAAYFLGEFGKDAKKALPLLQQVQEPEYAREAARIAIEKIEGDGARKPSD